MLSAAPATLEQGVGFDTLGAGTVIVKGPRAGRHHGSAGAPEAVHAVADSREGWVESVQLLLDCFFHARARPVFDYSGVRKAGEPIRVRAHPPAHTFAHLV